MKKPVFNEKTKQRATLMFSSEDARNRSINSPLGFVSLDMLKAAEQTRTPQPTQLDTAGKTDYSSTSTLFNQANSMSNVEKGAKLHGESLSGKIHSQTKAGDFDKYGMYKRYKLQDLTNQIGTFGGSPVEGFKEFNYKPKAREATFRRSQGESYADSLRKQTNVASSSAYQTGYNPASNVMGGRAGLDRAMRLDGLDPDLIASRYDAIGDSGAGRWAGLDPNSVQTTNSLYGTSDYNAFNY